MLFNVNNNFLLLLVKFGLNLAGAPTLGVRVIRIESKIQSNPN